MSQTIKGVEGEWGSKDGFSSIFYTLWESGDEFHNMCTVKGRRGDEIGNGESV